MKKKIVAIIGLVALMMMVMVPLALADGATPDISAVMGTATSSLQTQILGILGTVLPIGGAILAIILGVKFGLKFIRHVAK